MTRHPPFVALVLTLVLALIGCGGGAQTDGPAHPDGSQPESGVPDGGPPADKGPVPDGVLPADGTPPADGAPPADGPVTSKLPPPPPGAVLLRFSVDDSTDKAYAQQELQLKGTFSYDEKTNVISFDSGWGGPFVPLYDDGPNGLEGPGSVAGDHVHGAVVYLVPGSGGVTLEYGLISPAGWMWPDGANNKVTVQPGDPLVDLVPHKIPPRAGVGPAWVVDATKLNNKTVNPGYEAVVIRANATHWSPLPCNDSGVLADATAGDDKYTCRLVEQIGKGKLFPHLGLPRPGDQVRFYVDIGGNSYHNPAGIAVTLTSGSGSAAAAVTTSGSDLAFTVPTAAAPIPAPAPDNSPLPPGLRGDLPGGLFSLPASGIKGHHYVPGSYDAHRPTPVLVALHGAYEDGQWMVNVWKTLAEDRGMILLAPSSNGQSWDLFGSSPTPAEDLPLRNAITWLQGRYNVDAGQIGVEGFSDGATMALYMGLTHGKIFNVAMANSPGWSNNIKYPLPDKPAVYITHGDADPVLPVTNARWIKNTLIAAGYTVVYFEFPGGGHDFPTDHKIPMLDFLAQHAK